MLHGGNYEVVQVCDTTSWPGRRNYEIEAITDTTEVFREGGQV